MSNKPTKCFNCKFASEPFKIGGNTHYHCLHEKHAAGLESGDISAWDTLREFYSFCESHEYKPSKTNDDEE